VSRVLQRTNIKIVKPVTVSHWKLLKKRRSLGTFCTQSVIQGLILLTLEHEDSMILRRIQECCHIPEDLNPQRHCFLKTLFLVFIVASSAAVSWRSCEQQDVEYQ